ncbi:MAG: hypothetical protein AAF960_26905 [Bacteroidota bacterium]
MKIQLLFVLLSFTASENFSSENLSNSTISTVYHYRNNIYVTNFDGTRSTIQVSGNSATLFNADGTISEIYFGSSSSRIVAADGTMASVSHNGASSTVTRSDGSQFFVNHTPSTSSCSIAAKKHTIMHNFGFRKEWRNKNKIDVLVHMNWLVQKVVAEAIAESNDSPK